MKIYKPISQGSVATQIRCDGVLFNCLLSAGCVNGKILKIG